jgi:hypothetical protein
MYVCTGVHPSSIQIAGVSFAKIVLSTITQIPAKIESTTVHRETGTVFVLFTNTFGLHCL